MKKYKYFSPEEFQRATPSCVISQMNESFMDSLDNARGIAGVPFIVNSAYRSESWERAHNRAGTSFHCFGKAVDLSCRTSDARYKIVSALLRAGFKGIGISKSFIHVDARNVATPLIWMYNEFDED